MATITEIRTALAAAITTLDGVRAQDEVETSPNVSGSAVVVVVEYGGATYDAAFGGQADDLTFTLTALAPKTRAGRLKLDELGDPEPDSPTSLRTAVNGTLNSTVAWAIVRSSAGYREYGPDEAPYLGVEFTVGVGR